MGKVTKSLILGAALGAIAALLAAPRSGKQTQLLWKKKYAKVLAQVARDVAKAKKISHEQYEIIVDKALKIAAKTRASKKELTQLKDELMETWKTLQRKMK